MKTIVITGTSRGIGLATARKFLAEGWRVIGTSTSGMSALSHENFLGCQMDQSNPDSIKRFVQFVRSAVPTIDMLVNNAGILIDGGGLVVDSNKVRATLEVNVIGLIDLTEQLLPLLEPSGRVINVSSNYGAFSFPIDDETCGAYRLSKAALNMYTRHLAFRLQGQGVIVAALHPGWVKTDMGLSIATADDQPNRDPAQAADDIYALAIGDIDSGQFWKDGIPHSW